MRTQSLQMLIGTALIDPGFRRALLNGSRRHVLQSYPFTGEEIERMMAIQADSLEQFAGELHRQFVAASEEPAPLPLTRAYRARSEPIGERIYS